MKEILCHIRNGSIVLAFYDETGLIAKVINKIWLSKQTEYVYMNQKYDYRKKVAIDYSDISVHRKNSSLEL